MVYPAYIPGCTYPAWYREAIPSRYPSPPRVPGRLLTTVSPCSQGAERLLTTVSPVLGVPGRLLPTVIPVLGVPGRL